MRSNLYRFRSCRRLAIAGAVAGSLAGCMTPAVDRAPPAPDRPWQPRTDASGEIVPGPAVKSGPPAPRGYVLPANPAVAALPQPAAPIDEAKVYDLADLIDLAESTNPDTRIAWNAARDAALAAGIARSTYLPHVTATALGGYRASDGRSTALGLSADDDGSAAGLVSSISLRWLLFDFGQRKAVVAGADQLTIVANIRFTAAHQQLIHAVSLAFYNYSATRARSVTARQSLVEAQEIQKAAEARLHRGIGTIIEVAQARQATAAANLAVVQARGGEEDAYATLLAAMGVSPLAKLTIADASNHQLSPALEADIDKVVASALGRRPDVLAAYATLKASAADVRAARAEFLPKVFVSGTGSYATGRLSVSAVPSATLDEGPTLNVSNRRFGATVLGGVSVPLYDGGSRRAALERARNREDSARLGLERVKENAIREIVAAQNGLRTSLAAYDAARELRVAAQTTFDAALAAFRNGVGSATDVALAQRQLLEARNVLDDSYSIALSAAATLALSAGELGGAPNAAGPAGQ